MKRATGRRQSGDRLGTTELVAVRAALAAGLTPSQAIASANAGVLEPVARSVRLGRTLFEESQRVDTGDAAADLLVRALGLAERAGAGSGRAVEHALSAVREDVALSRLLAVRTAQARGTARLLSAVPVGAWLLLVGLDAASLRFYGTPMGLGTALGAIVLAAAGSAWSQRLVRKAAAAAGRSDPLAPKRPTADPRRALAVGVPVLVLIGVGIGPVPGLLAAVLAAALLARPRSRKDGSAVPETHGGGAAEAVDLVTIALAAGLSATAAVGLAASVAPGRARPALAAAARRLRGGWPVDEAFADTGLGALGAVLAIADRWGAPPVEPLRGLADDLRAERRAAAEESAERLQLALVFPTTLLTLPAFVLGVVPPLVWSAFAG